LHGLQGIVSAALGRLGFRFSFVVLLLFNFVYTVYNAFSKKIKREASAITFNNCSCDPIDRVIYNLITFGCITLWVIFLLICTSYSIYKLIVKLQCCTSYKADSSDEELIPDRFLKREFSKLATQVFYLNKRSLHNKEINSLDEINLGVHYLLDHLKHKKSIREEILLCSR